MIEISKNKAEEYIKNCKGKSIAVIGDVMLDHYYWGNVSRVSPEAPVPVVDIENETFHLGGAANVANNLVALGIEPLLCGTIGKDPQGKRFIQETEDNRISSLGLYEDEDRSTTVKTRIIGNNQQIVRLDQESRRPLSGKGEQYILEALRSRSDLNGIIFEDYDKGTISKSLIEAVMDYAHKIMLPVFVDPKELNFWLYHGVTVFKPNRKEARAALGTSLKTSDEILSGGKSLLKKLECENVLLTLGADGMMLFENNSHEENIGVSSVPTMARSVSDVSGAGDTAIATLAAIYIAGANIKEAATLANYAAGVVCEEPGIVPITKEKLLSVIP